MSAGAALPVVAFALLVNVQFSDHPVSPSWIVAVANPKKRKFAFFERSFTFLGS